ncbi:transient receptor potential cation channel subfamily V member 3-like isoform X4 [Hyperolius riggenbachi]|uniref:transient receptor potential cation channel subfamily V member 3-like isoform X4 n=1 Tax=Hyperolius riggenbachi TaxID=752182 RepID=UPI0035A3707E
MTSETLDTSFTTTENSHVIEGLYGPEESIALQHISIPMECITEGKTREEMESLSSEKESIHLIDKREASESHEELEPPSGEDERNSLVGGSDTSLSGPEVPPMAFLSARHLSFSAPMDSNVDVNSESHEELEPPSDEDKRISLVGRSDTSLCGPEETISFMSGCLLLSSSMDSVDGGRNDFTEKRRDCRRLLSQAFSEGRSESVKKLLKDIKDLSSKDFFLDTFTLQDNGRTCLVKELLKINNNRLEIVHILVSFTAKHGFLEQFLNAACTDEEYEDFFLDKLTSQKTGQNCLMKALLNIDSDTPKIVRTLISSAEKHGFLKQFINAEYTDENYKGQTALHIAIERRQLDIVEYLIEKGAKINVLAQGRFFHPRNKDGGFYFGETPLALAACTNQPDIVDLLMEKEPTCVTMQDSAGNTVLHALVTTAEESEVQNKFLIDMYEKITRGCNHKLEDIRNNDGFSPMQLAAKTGKLEVLKYILSREIKEGENRVLSRRFTDWAYGPVSSYLYDLRDVDTSSKNSVLELVVYNQDIDNRHELLALEPLHTLLHMKWKSFARYMFFMSFLLNFLYNTTFTFLYYDPDEMEALRGRIWRGGVLQLIGQVYTFTWALGLTIQEGITILRFRPSDLKSILTDAWFHLLFFTQALLVITSTICFVIGVQEQLIFIVLAVVLGWINMMYYTRGVRSLGVYSVMLQRHLHH